MKRREFITLLGGAAARGAGAAGGDPGGRVSPPLIARRLPLARISPGPGEFGGCRLGRECRRTSGGDRGDLAAN